MSPFSELGYGYDKIKYLKRKKVSKNSSSTTTVNF